MRAAIAPKSEMPTSKGSSDYSRVPVRTYIQRVPDACMFSARDTHLNDSQAISSVCALVQPCLKMPWLSWPWTSSSSQQDSPRPQREFDSDSRSGPRSKRLENKLEPKAPKEASEWSKALAHFKSIPPYYLVAGTVLLLLLGGTGDRFYMRHLRRIPNAGWITPDIIKRKQWIKGYVTECFAIPCRVEL